MWKGKWADITLEKVLKNDKIPQRITLYLQTLLKLIGLYIPPQG